MCHCRSRSPESRTPNSSGCAKYQHTRIEYRADGESLVKPPTDLESSFRNAEITVQLGIWARSARKGPIAESSGGFLLPSGARRSPDAAWISKERRGLRPTCPEFVVELLSPSDRRKTAHAKMLEWIDNGADPGWLINPRRRAVTIYRRGQERRSGLAYLKSRVKVH